MAATDEITTVVVDEGPRGPAGTMEVGSTSTLSPGEDATVTNSGSSTEAVFDFGIPQGDPLTFRGAWDNTATYAQSDAVTHSDKLWAANQATDAGDEPGVSGKWTEIPTVNQILADTTFQIPTDYATLQAAIDDLADRFVQRGVTVTLNIESGHALTGGVEVRDGDYSMFRITSDDATVSVDGASFPDAASVVHGVYARLPKLSCLVDMGGAGSNGYKAEEGSIGWVGRGAGVRNAGGNDPARADGAGVFVLSNSAVYCDHVGGSGGVVFTGCRRNVWVSKTSTLHAEEITATGATGDFAVFLSRGAIFHGSNMDASGAANGGLRCFRSFVHAANADLSDAGTDAVDAREGGMVSMPNATLDGAGDDGMFVDGPVEVDISGASIANAVSEGIDAANGATVNANGVTVTGCDNGSIARHGVNIILDTGEVSGSADTDLWVLQGSYTGAFGTTTTNGAPDVGDTNVAAFNALDGSNGIIWA